MSPDTPSHQPTPDVPHSETPLLRLDQLECNRQPIRTGQVDLAQLTPSSRVATGPLSRCPEKGCPWRWVHGPDRPCRDHRDEYAMGLHRMGETR